MERPIEVTWEGEHRFLGGAEGGAQLAVDGSRAAAPSPVEALVVALAGCSAIDVIDILQKRRAPAASLRVRAEYARAPEPPRRLTELHLRFTVATEAERAQVERALELSFGKYCSVSASLAPDTRIRWSLELLPADAALSPA